MPTVTFPQSCNLILAGLAGPSTQGAYKPNTLCFGHLRHNTFLLSGKPPLFTTSKEAVNKGSGRYLKSHSQEALWGKPHFTPAGYLLGLGHRTQPMNGTTDGEPSPIQLMDIPLHCNGARYDSGGDACRDSPRSGPLGGGCTSSRQCRVTGSVRHLYWLDHPSPPPLAPSLSDKSWRSTALLAA